MKQVQEFIMPTLRPDGDELVRIVHARREDQLADILTKA